MRRIKKLTHSIFFRVMSAFFVSFICAMVITVLLVNAFQYGSVENALAESVEDKASQMKALMQNEYISPEQAVAYLESSDFDCNIYASAEQTGRSFSDDEMQLLNSGNIILNTRGHKVPNMEAVFCVDGMFVILKPNVHSNSIVLFLATQRIMAFLFVGFGAILIFATTATIVKPIRRISEASKKVAAGDFSVNIPAKGRHEVADLIRNFNTMVQALSANEYLHKDFVSNVSHEFKTPITSLKGYAKLLKDVDLPVEKRIEYAAIIATETDRLSKLSSNLLKLSELENDVIMKMRENFSLDEQIRDAILLLQNDWEAKELNMQIELDDVKFFGNQQLLYQVWINIISNAIKYSHQNGLLKITLAQADQITVKVTDGGSGIPHEALDKIFLRFYKSDQSRNSAGTGLGLPIAKKIVELHGGSICAESIQGQGSTFTVHFDGSNIYANEQ